MAVLGARAAIAESEDGQLRARPVRELDLDDLAFEARSPDADFRDGTDHTILWRSRSETRSTTSSNTSSTASSVVACRYWNNCSES